MRFWGKKKQTIDKSFKKKLLEELARLRNDSVLLTRDIEKLTKKIKEENI